MKVSIVIPTLNEEQNLPGVLSALPKTIDEVIVVDGYSKDKTASVAKRYGARVLYDKLGKGSALREGMRNAEGDIIVTIDADQSNRVSELNLLVEAIKVGYDIAMGSRFATGGGTHDMQWYRKLGNKFFVMLVNTLFHTKYSDLCYGYRAFRRTIIPRLKLESDGFGIETEISIRAAKLKAKVIEIPSLEKARRHGEGNLRTFADGWKIFRRIMKERFVRR